jgi:hypothetical protein
MSRAKKIKRGTDPRREDQQNKKRSGNLPSTFFLSPSRAWRSLLTACCKLTTVALCSSRVRTWSAFEMLRAISSPSSFETSSSRSFSDACALSRAACSRSSADRASARAARSCWSCPSASWRAAHSCRSCSSAATTAVTLAARAAFNSLASLAFCSASLALSSARSAGTAPP